MNSVIKKLVLLFFIAACAPLLCGCGSIYASNYREIEHLLVIQTMGIDKRESGIRLTLASAADKNNAPVRLEAEGESVTSAIEKLRSLTPDAELFCAHINHIVVGEEAAREGVTGILDYICRSSDIRTDVPVYVVRGGEAGELVMNAGDDKAGVSELLDGLRHRSDSAGDILCPSAAELIRSLERQGSALLCALEVADAADGEGITAHSCGCGILRGGALCGFLDREETVGAALLLGRAGVCELVLRDPSGKSVTAELSAGTASVTPLTDERGELTGLTVSVGAAASIAESERDAAGAEILTARLEETLCEHLKRVLMAEKELNADFLGLGVRIERAMPEMFARLGAEGFAEALAELEFRVRLGAELRHTNDLRDA